MTLGELISAFRKEHGNMSMDAFAAMAGLSKAYVSMIERNKTHRGEAPIPSIKTYRKIATAMNLDVDDLIRKVDGKISIKDDLPSVLTPAPPLRAWPVIGAAACGEPVHREVFDVTVLAPEDIKADAVFRCDGDSMVGARIFDGDLVFIRFEADFYDGGIYLVRVDDAYTLKRVYREPDSLRLVSENPKEPTRIISGADLEQTEIVGKAVCFLSRVV